jgi:hypothetical protein
VNKSVHRKIRKYHFIRYLAHVNVSYRFNILNCISRLPYCFLNTSSALLFHVPINSYSERYSYSITMNYYKNYDRVNRVPKFCCSLNFWTFSSYFGPKTYRPQISKDVSAPSFRPFTKSAQYLVKNKSYLYVFYARILIAFQKMNEIREWEN